MAGKTREQVLAEYQAFYDGLPERAEALIRRIEEMSKALAPADFQGYARMTQAVREGVDDVFGIIREGENHGAARPELELARALSGESIYELPEVRSRLDQSLPVQERIAETRRSLDKRFLDRIKDHGKALLNSGEPKTAQEIVTACYWKHGMLVDLDNPQWSKTVNEFVQNVERKNLGALLNRIGNNSMNPGSEEAFSRLTGVNLGKTQKERVARLQEWAGPERVAAMKRAQADRAQEQERERKTRGMTNAWEGLKNLNVRMGDGRTMSAQAYVTENVGEGRDRIVSRKEGAVTVYYLRNPEKKEFAGVRKPAFTGFAKAVLALDPEGDVRKAMEKAGLGQQLPEVKKPAPARDQESVDPFEAKRRAVVQALEAGGWERVKKLPNEPEYPDLLKKRYVVHKDPAKGGEFFRGKSEFETEVFTRVQGNGIIVDFGNKPYFVTDPTAISLGRDAPSAEDVARRIDDKTKGQLVKEFEHLGVTAILGRDERSEPAPPMASRRDLDRPFGLDGSAGTAAGGPADGESPLPAVVVTPAGVMPPAGGAGVEKLSKALDAVRREQMVVRQKDGSDKTVSVRDYLDAGIQRGMTAVEDRGDSLRWHNPSNPQFSRSIPANEPLAGVLRQAVAVDRDIAKAIQSVRRGKNAEMELS